MNQPSPAIVAQSAVQRLPRWALLLLCVAYIVPGFVGRNPWRGADMAALGYMLELAQGHTAWLAPMLGGMVPETDGLLPYWLGAWAMGLLAPLVPPELAARAPFVLLLVLTLLATWYGIYALARRPGAQPVAFAFGGEANPQDYARAMADGGLLALLACLGLAQPSHETTSYLVQLCATALVFHGLAAAPLRQASAAVTLLAGCVGLALSGAPTLAVLYPLGAAALFVAAAPAPDAPPAPPALPVFSIAAPALALLAALGAALLALALDLWSWRLTWPHHQGKDALDIARLLVWFTWPAWPLALWTLWRWRQQIFQRRPQWHLALPLWFLAVSLASTAGTQPMDRALLLGLPALAALAAFALPTLRRSMAALIDWFTLLFFSICAIAIWVIWISTHTGFPAKPAANVAKLARGFVPEFSLLAFGVALAATLAWCALVGWRVGRHRNPIWKSLVLPAGGTTLSWLLLLTLWLPMLDYARSDVPQMRALASLAGQPGCMLMHGLDRTQTAALQFHGKLRLLPLLGPGPHRTQADEKHRAHSHGQADTQASTQAVTQADTLADAPTDAPFDRQAPAQSAGRCDWLVVAPLSPTPSADPSAPKPLQPSDLTGWTLYRTVSRPTSRTDVLRLYQRVPAEPAAAAQATP